MVIKEIWGVPKGRMSDYFAALPGAHATDDGYALCGCSVTLRELPESSFGPVSLPRTEVEFAGEDEQAVRELHRGMFMRFLSAGG